MFTPHTRWCFWLVAKVLADRERARKATALAKRGHPLSLLLRSSALSIAIGLGAGRRLGEDAHDLRLARHPRGLPRGMSSERASANFSSGPGERLFRRLERLFVACAGLKRP